MDISRVHTLVYNTPTNPNAGAAGAMPEQPLQLDYEHGFV